MIDEHLLTQEIFFGINDENVFYFFLGYNDVGDGCLVSGDKVILYYVETCELYVAKATFLTIEKHREHSFIFVKL